jgi:GT2 family glycosyltransferase
MIEAKVAIIYLSYHSDEYLSDAIEAIKKSTFPKEKCVLVFVDNPHPKFGSSVDSIKKIIETNKNFLPQTKIISLKENLGFSGGNNEGISWAIDNGFDYIFLHNQDGSVSPDCLENMVSAMEADKNIGCAQALVMLDGTTKINSAGNSFNYLGFGFIPNYGIEEKYLKLTSVKEVGYASGAALMLRAENVKKFGGLDNDLFAYHEDVEYSLRLRFVGLKPVIVPNAKFFHKYIFNKDSSKFYYLERNRYAVLLMYYKWPTLILILPILLLLEVGLIGLFYSKGWLKEKIDAYRYWINTEHLKKCLKKRAVIQKKRTISDRQFISTSSAKILLSDDQLISSSILLDFGNILINIYKIIVNLLVFW